MCKSKRHRRGAVLVIEVERAIHHPVEALVSFRLSFFLIQSVHERSGESRSRSHASGGPPMDPGERPRKTLTAPPPQLEGVHIRECAGCTDRVRVKPGCRLPCDLPYVCDAMHAGCRQAELGYRGLTVGKWKQATRSWPTATGGRCQNKPVSVFHPRLTWSGASRDGLNQGGGADDGTPQLPQVSGQSSRCPRSRSPPLPRMSRPPRSQKPAVERRRQGGVGWVGGVGYLPRARPMLR
jgi:hypothetical protein